MDGFGSQQIASCVHNSLFDDYMMDKDGMIKGMLHGTLFDVQKAYAVISNEEKSAAIPSKKLDIGAWNSAARRGKGTVQRKSCMNCLDLETDLLRPNTDSLRVEATLMSTGAVAGILWLAMGAG